MGFKPVRMSDKTSCVCMGDDAVDEEASDFDAYVASMLAGSPGSWRDNIKVKEGHTITEFVIGVIPPEELNRIGDECSGKANEMRWRCFLWGLRDINGWPEVVPKKARGDVEYVDPDWLKATFVRGLRAVAIWVGGAAWAFNSVTDAEIKN